jgi:hypothetical protein
MRGPLSEIFEALIKIPAALLLLGGLFYGIYWFLAVQLPDERRARDDPGHVERVFHDVLNYGAVLASRAWHRLGAEPLDCTFAIVSLPANAPQDSATSHAQE